MAQILVLDARLNHPLLISDMKVLVLVFAAFAAVKAQQACTPAFAANLHKCLEPVNNISNRVSASNPDLNHLAFPLFNFEKSDIEEFCKVLPDLESCVKKADYTNCPQHVVYLIINSLFIHPCGLAHKKLFFDKFDCIHDNLMNSTECMDAMRVPPVATKDWDKCTKAPALHKCASEIVSEKCDDKALAVFEKSLESAGCNYRKEADATNIRRKPVAKEPTETKSKPAPVKCDFPSQCKDLYSRYTDATAKNNITHPLFALNEEDFEDVCQNVTLAPCSEVCADNPVATISAAVGKICEEPEKLARSTGCIAAIRKRKPECLEKIDFTYKCSGLKDFKTCVRVMAITQPACRQGFSSMISLLKGC